MQNAAKIENCVQTLAQTGLVARVTSLEASAASGSSSPDSSRSWKNSRTVMAPQPLGLSGPMAQGHRMTTGIRDVDLILSQALRMSMREVPFLLRFPCEQHHKGITSMREVPSCYGSHANKTTKGLGACAKCRLATVPIRTIPQRDYELDQ